MINIPRCERPTEPGTYLCRHGQGSDAIQVVEITFEKSLDPKMADELWMHESGDTLSWALFNVDAWAEFWGPIRIG